MSDKKWTKEEIETLTPEFKHWKTLNGTLKNTLAKALLQTRLDLKTSQKYFVTLDQELAKQFKRNDCLRGYLEQIAESEQAHCYGTDSEVNDLMQTRHDLRKCGDLAREALKEKP